MLTAEIIKQKAKELGATVCRIGKIYDESDIQKDPRMILPHATCIIGFGFAVPRALYHTMEIGSQFYTYVNEGVKYIDEELAEIFLLKMGAIIENEGYDACLQRTVPGMKAKGDKTTNPEVFDTFELVSEPVEPGKPAPDVIIDFGKAAIACGIGEPGLNGKIIAKDHGPYMRYAFIITDAPLECDKPLTETLCDKCGECIKVCPGAAISEDGLDTWQCAVYYRGAHKSNPFMTDDFLKGNPDREAILNGDYRFDAVSARALYPELQFLPKTNWGYAPCICGKRCDIACYKHLKSIGKI